MAYFLLITGLILVFLGWRFLPAYREAWEEKVSGALSLEGTTRGVQRLRDGVPLEALEQRLSDNFSRLEQGIRDSLLSISAQLDSILENLTWRPDPGDGFQEKTATPPDHGTSLPVQSESGFAGVISRVVKEEENLSGIPPLAREVIRGYREGKGTAQLAQEMGRNKGEIELILKLFQVRDS